MLASLGKVTVVTAGTPVRVTSGQSVPGAHIPAQGVVIQALSANTGKIFVGISTMNKSTLVGVLFVIGAPASATATPTSFSVSQLSTSGIGVEDLWLDADNSGEGVTVGYVQG